MTPIAGPDPILEHPKTILGSIPETLNQPTSPLSEYISSLSEPHIDWDGIDLQGWINGNQTNASTDDLPGAGEPFSDGLLSNPSNRSSVDVLDLAPSSDEPTALPVHNSNQSSEQLQDDAGNAYHHSPKRRRVSPLLATPVSERKRIQWNGKRSAETASMTFQR